MIYGVLAPSRCIKTPVNSGDKLWENLKLVDWKASKEVMVQEGKNLFSGYGKTGGWTNPFEKYESNWKSSPNRSENNNLWNHHLVVYLCKMFVKLMGVYWKLVPMQLVSSFFRESWWENWWYSRLVFASTLPETNIAPENGWLEEEMSFWDDLFSGAMLVSGRAYYPAIIGISKNIANAKYNLHNENLSQHIIIIIIIIIPLRRQNKNKKKHPNINPQTGMPTSVSPPMRVSILSLLSPFFHLSVFKFWCGPPLFWGKDHGSMGQLPLVLVRIMAA